MLKLAFIGLGRVFQHYLKHWDEILSALDSDVVVTALCDTRLETHAIAKATFRQLIAISH